MGRDRQFGPLQAGDAAADGPAGGRERCGLRLVARKVGSVVFDTHYYILCFFFVDLQ